MSNDPQQRIAGILIREGCNQSEIQAALGVSNERAALLWYRAEMNYRRRVKPESRKYSEQKRAYDRLYRKVERLAGLQPRARS
jgi:hypothetical protein